MRFYYYSQDEETASLTLRLRTDQDGADDTVLWTRDSSQDYSWHRAEVIMFVPVNSKVREDNTHTNTHTQTFVTWR